MPDNSTVHANTFGGYGRRGQSAGLASTYQVLMGFCKHIGITPWRLFTLLGVRPVGNGYRWFRAERSPSSMFLIRLGQLQLWNSQGIPVCNMREILWEESLILWLDNSVTQENHSPDGAGLIPPVEAHGVWQLAMSLSHTRKRAMADRRRFNRNAPVTYRHIYKDNGSLPGTVSAMEHHSNPAENGDNGTNEHSE